VTHHAAALSREGGAAWVEAVASGDLDAFPGRLRVLCRYALKLTVTPWAMTQGDVQALRAVGLTDRDIVDANQVVAYYNYVNRVAEGLGVELEDYWPGEARRPRRYRVREDPT
jgi:uncharacterized peroxidase-related enzyme